MKRQHTAFIKSINLLCVFDSFLLLIPVGAARASSPQLPADEQQAYRRTLSPAAHGFIASLKEVAKEVP
jgi:hypothetical protein